MGRRSGGLTGPVPLRGGAGMGEGFPCLEGPSGAQIGGSMPSISPAQSAREALLALRTGPMHSEAHSGPHWSWGHRTQARGEQEREMGGALQDQRSRRGAEGICPAHSGRGSLLGSQAGSPALRDQRQPGPLLLS